MPPDGVSSQPHIGLDRIAQAVPGALYLYDAGAGRFEYASEALAAIAGRDLLDGSRGRLFESLIHPDDLDLFTAHLDELERLTVGEALEVEFRILRADAQVRSLVARHSVISRLPNGRAASIFGVAVDVTGERTDAARLQFQDELLDAARQAVFATSFDGAITYWNSGAAALFGLTSAEAAGKPLDDVLPPAVLSEVREGRSWTGELNLKSQEAPAHSVRVTVNGIRDSAGYLFGAVPVMDELARRIAAERALRSSRERYRLASEGSNDAIWDYDLDRGEICFSPRWREILGAPPATEPAQLREWFRFVFPEDLPLLRAALDAQVSGSTNHLKCEYRVRRQDGQERWILCRGLAVRDPGGRVTRIAGSQTDITPRKRADEQLRRAALYDSLTALPNHALLLDRLAERLKAWRLRRRGSFALLFIDLDRFKFVNDSLGHASGDELLVLAARRIGACLAAGDTLARLGGDEFLVLLDEAAEAEAVAHRVLAAFAEPFPVAGRRVYSGASIGIALPSSSYERPEEIVRDADAAMYRAKSLGRSRHAVFSKDLHHHALTQLTLDSDLRHAMQEKRFVAWYQPVVSFKDMTVAGFEALARWPRGGGVVLEAEAFIRSAEDTGLVAALDRQILEHAVRHQAASRRAAGPAFIVSVNLSARTLLDPGFALRAQGLCDAFQVPTAGICFEISERMPLDAADAALPVLEALRRQGFLLALDDFGIGASSLRHLSVFPLNLVKIDRSFVAGIKDGSRGLDVVKSVIALGHSLGLSVVAEGVENEEQSRLLRGLGCDYGQGFFFGTPEEAQSAAAAG